MCRIASLEQFLGLEALTLPGRFSRRRGERPIGGPASEGVVSVASIGTFSSSPLLIEDMYPCVDAGRFPVKRICGEVVDVWADIVRDGHNVLAAELIWRPERDSEWRHVPFRLHDNDRWIGSF